MQINRLNSYLDTMPYSPLPSFDLQKLCGKLIGKDVEISYEVIGGEIEKISGILEKVAVIRSNPRQTYNLLNCVLDGEGNLFVDGEKMLPCLAKYTYGIIKSIRLNDT